MNKIIRDFVSDENRDYTFKIGRTLASALSGFIAGTIASVIIFFVFYYLFIK
jgi:hypothetical protein